MKNVAREHRDREGCIVVVCVAMLLFTITGSAQKADGGDKDVAKEEIRDILRLPHGLNGRIPPGTMEWIAEVKRSPDKYAAIVAECAKDYLTEKRYQAVGVACSLLGEMGAVGVSNAVDVITLVRAEQARGNLSENDARSLRDTETIGFAALKGAYNSKAVDLALQALQERSDLEVASQTNYILQTDGQKVVERIDAWLVTEGLPDQAKKAMARIREKVIAKENSKKKER